MRRCSEPVLQDGPGQDRSSQNEFSQDGVSQDGVSQDGLKIHIEPPPGHVELSPLVLEALAQAAPRVETPSAKGVVCRGVLDCSLEAGTASIMLGGVQLIGRNQAEVRVATTRSSRKPPGVWTTVVGSLFEWNGEHWTWIKNTDFLIT